MKSLLRLALITLTLATTGLFAQAATDAVETSPQGQHQAVKTAKKKHKKHKKKKAV